MRRIYEGKSDLKIIQASARANISEDTFSDSRSTGGAIKDALPAHNISQSLKKSSISFTPNFHIKNPFLIWNFEIRNDPVFEIL